MNTTQWKEYEIMHGNQRVAAISRNGIDISLSFLDRYLLG